MRRALPQGVNYALPMHTLEIFFDCSSPWTYLAFEAVQPLTAMPGVETRWKPILVGGVFNAVNPSVYENRANPVPAKTRSAFD